MYLHTTSYRLLTKCQNIIIQFQENSQTDGWMDGQKIFHWAAVAAAGGPTIFDWIIDSYKNSIAFNIFRYCNKNLIFFHIIFDGVLSKTKIWLLYFNWEPSIFNWVLKFNLLWVSSFFRDFFIKLRFCRLIKQIVVPLMIIVKNHVTFFYYDFLGFFRKIWISAGYIIKSQQNCRLW